MAIEQIYVAGCRADLRLTRCCIASIRRWYPDIPISLIVDESLGTYSTARLERTWGVTRFPTERKQFGLGFGKLEPLFLPGRQRCLILDSDLIFLGRVLDALDGFTEDYVVARHDFAPEAVARDFFDLDRLREFDPDFASPGYTFNTGQFVATTGLLCREDFAPVIDFTEPPRLRFPETFRAADQGVLNYVLLKKARQGALTLRRHHFMKWPGALAEGAVRPEQFTQDWSFPFVLHWAGCKPQFIMFSRMRHGDLLRHFEAESRARGAGSGLVAE